MTRFHLDQLREIKINQWITHERLVSLVGPIPDHYVRPGSVEIPLSEKGEAADPDRITFQCLLPKDPIARIYVGICLWIRVE